MKYNTIEELRLALNEVGMNLISFEEKERQAIEDGWFPRRSGRTTKIALYVLLYAQENNVAIISDPSYLGEQMITRVKGLAESLNLDIKLITTSLNDIAISRKVILIRDHA